MALGAGCVLLFAGAFPVFGAPEVFRSGSMWLLGAAVCVLCGYGAWRLSRGMRWRFLCGVIFTFLAAAGGAALFQFGKPAWEYASVGGAMWFGALGMFCLALVGLLFAGIFGFFAWRLMTRRLWLAAVHGCGLVILIGVCTDALGELSLPLRMVPASGKTVYEVRGKGGEVLPLGFGLSLENFSLSYYEQETYSLYRRSGVPARWVVVGRPEQQGDELMLGDRRWSLSSLRRTAEMPRPFLLCGTEEAPELLMQDERTVRDYCASCRVDYFYRGRKESRTVDIRVNEPLSFKGIVVHLESYRPMGEKNLVVFRVRRAPGRLLALAGMVGLMISTTAWCWKGKEKETTDSPALS